MPDTAIALLEVLGCFQIGSLVFLYVADRRLFFVSKSGVTQVKALKLLKTHRYLFVYYKRKEGHITKHAFKCMIAYYIINAVGCAALFIQFFWANGSFIAATCSFIIMAHVGLIAAVGTPLLNNEQQKMADKYIQDERERKKKEKEKYRPKR